MIPIVTVGMFTDQLSATVGAVVQLQQAVDAWLRERAATPAALASVRPLGGQWGVFRGSFQRYVESQRVPPVFPLPIPGPLPAVVLIRPGAWQTLLAWDRAVREWVARWRRAGVADAPMPPAAAQPPAIDPKELGLGLGAGFSLGTVAALVLGGLYLFGRR